MSTSAGNPARNKRGRDAAALSAVEIRRADRVATSNPKLGDLTLALKQHVGAGTPLSPEDRDERALDVTSVSNSRQAALLPEPYFASEAEITPSYIVHGAAAAPAIPPTAPARSSFLPYDDIRSADDLVYYWEELRGYRALPLLGNVDRTRIAISWPNTLLVSFSKDRSGMPELTRLSRLTGEVEASPLLTEWIFSSSRKVAEICKAMETERSFPGRRNTCRYHMMLLPFAGAEGESDHVLCHLRCID